MNVTVDGGSLSFTPDKGVGDEVFGFQPGSTYYYVALFLVENVYGNEINVWYTLEGDMAELYDDGVFWLDIEGSPDGRWDQHGAVPTGMTTMRK